MSTPASSTSRSSPHHSPVLPPEEPPRKRLRFEFPDSPELRAASPTFSHAAEPLRFNPHLLAGAARVDLAFPHANRPAAAPLTQAVFEQTLQTLRDECRVGTSFHDINIQRPLGAGAFSQVHLGTQSDGSPVVIKILKERVGKVDPNALSSKTKVPKLQFLHTQKANYDAAVRANIPCANLLNNSTTDLFSIYEFVPTEISNFQSLLQPGQTLDNLPENHPLLQIKWIIRKIHTNQLICDLKADNLRIRSSGEVVLVDHHEDADPDEWDIELRTALRRVCADGRDHQLYNFLNPDPTQYRLD